MLAQVRVLVIDKTGTLTRGSARLAALRTLGAHGEAEVLRLAASVDQARATRWRGPWSRRPGGAA